MECKGFSPRSTKGNRKSVAFCAPGGGTCKRAQARTTTVERTPAVNKPHSRRKRFGRPEGVRCFFAVFGRFFRGGLGSTGKIKYLCSQNRDKKVRILRIVLFSVLFWALFEGSEAPKVSFHQAADSLTVLAGEHSARGSFAPVTARGGFSSSVTAYRGPASFNACGAPAPVTVCEGPASVTACGELAEVTDCGGPVSSVSACEGLGWLSPNMLSPVRTVGAELSVRHLPACRGEHIAFRPAGARMGGDWCAPVKNRYRFSCFADAAPVRAISSGSVGC